MPGAPRRVRPVFAAGEGTGRVRTPPRWPAGTKLRGAFPTDEGRGRNASPPGVILGFYTLS